MSARLAMPMVPQPKQTKARGCQIIGDEFHEWPAGVIRRKSVMVRDAAAVPWPRLGRLLRVIGARLILARAGRFCGVWFWVFHIGRRSAGPGSHGTRQP